MFPPHPGNSLPAVARWCWWVRWWEPTPSLPPSLRSSHTSSSTAWALDGALRLSPTGAIPLSFPLSLPVSQGTATLCLEALVRGGGILVHLHFNRFNRFHHRLTPSSSAKLHWFNNPGTRKLLSAKDGKHRGLKLPPVGPIITSPDGIYNLEGRRRQKRKLHSNYSNYSNYYVLR